MIDRRMILELLVQHRVLARSPPCAVVAGRCEADRRTQWAALAARHRAEQDRLRRTRSAPVTRENLRVLESTREYPTVS
jgi:hypothetical protein